jgi:hypothetical protein
MKMRIYSSAGIAENNLAAWAFLSLVLPAEHSDE